MTMDDTFNLHHLSPMKGVKMAFLNIRSLLTNINSLKHELDNVVLTALGISETWLNTKIPDLLVNVNGFNIFRLDRSISKRGGGVAIFVRSDLAVECVPSSYNVSNEDVELLSVYVKFENQKNYLITTVYIPPKANPESALEAILNCSSLYNPNKHHWIVGGDFNLDYLGKGSRKRDKVLLTSFSNKANHTQIINNPSRVTKKTQSLIDLIFTSSPEFMVKGGTIPCNISDHDIVYIVAKKPKQQHKILKTEF